MRPLLGRYGRWRFARPTRSPIAWSQTNEPFKISESIGSIEPSHTNLHRQRSDPDDGVFIHSAIAVGVGWLVSGDDDLLVLSRVQGVEMLTSTQALGRVGG